MEKYRHCWSLLLILWSSNLTAQIDFYSGQTPGGAFYRIAVPGDWQPEAGLVIWNHGYQGYSDMGPEPEPALGPLENEVLAQGFALAASSYRQTGWAVFSSHLDNQQLYQRFVETVGEPQRIYLQGASLGGIVTVRDLEAGLLPDIDGALLMCGAVAGARNWYNALDLRAIYEAVCRDVDNGELPTGSWYEIPDLLSGELQFLQSLERCTGLISLQLFDTPFVSLLQSTEQRQRLDKILQLTGLELDFLPLVLGYAVFELPRLVNDPGKLAGARPFSNTGIDYGDPIINLSVRRQAALPSARQFLLDNYTPGGTTGDTRMVAIHTSRDGLVSVNNQQFLRQLIDPDMISTAVAVEEQASHCGFNEAEGLAAWRSLLDWTDGGARPTAADIQNNCLAITNRPANCRFDPGFVSGSDPVRFPREKRVTASSTVEFNESNGQLEVESLQIDDEPAQYAVTLQQLPAHGLHFDVSATSKAGNSSEWSHRARYFSRDNLLYLPSLKASPPRPGSNRFDVYLQYFSGGQRQWLELLEYEELP